MAATDAWEKMLVIESSQGHFCFPGKSGHTRDRGKVVASNIYKFIDEAYKTRCIELIDARSVLLYEHLIMWQEFCTPLMHEQLDTEPCCKGHCHGHPSRMNQSLRKCIAQELPKHAGGTRRKEVKCAKVPTVNVYMYRLWDRDASKMVEIGVEPILYPRKPPTCEERRHGVAQPLAEPNVACPGARLRGFPYYRLWQGGDRPSLEENQFSPSQCPLNVLGMYHRNALRRVERVRLQPAQGPHQ